MANPTPTLIGIPWDANSSFMRGAAAAPPLVREALFSPASNLWTELGVDLGAPGAVSDAGDLSLPDTADAIGIIEAAVRLLIQDGGAPLAIGGDHAVTYPVVRAVAARHPGLTILHVDAHPDLYDEFEGNRLSHACPFARILEDGLVRQLVQVGIRTMNRSQREQAERFDVEVIPMRQWSPELVLAFDGPVYVSVDLDVLDPAFAPGVAHHEPGGCSTRDVLRVIQSLRGRLVGADVVELNPSRDLQDVTARAAAKIVKELAARLLERY